MEKSLEQNTQNVVVLIPCLDPDKNMVEYIMDIKKAGFDVIIVDDGSRKNVEQIDILGRADCVILRHRVNQGKGRALKTGFNYILNTYSEYDIAGVVTADADGQHRIEDIINVAQRLKAEKKLVLGVRNFKEKNVPFKSRSGNRITTAVFEMLYGKKIQDTQTGLRGIPYDFLFTCLQCRGERFEYEIVMLIEAVKSNMVIEELPIQTIYFENNRETHFSAVKDSVKIYKEIMCGGGVQYVFSSILSFGVDISVFSLLTKLIGGGINLSRTIFISTFFARLFSSLLNFAVNKKMVFKSQVNTRKAICRYYILCVLQMICSWWLVVNVLQRLPWNTTAIKVVVDSILFLISYQIQYRWVFREGKK